MKFKALSKSCALSVAAILATFPHSVLAAGNPVSKANPDVQTNSNTDSVINYWTPANLASAKPLNQPAAPKLTASPAASTVTGTPVSGSGRAPTVNLAPKQQLLFTPQPQNINHSGVTPNNVGSRGAHFTSSRLIPLSADVEYPYRTTGKLFFTIPGQGNFVCSASVLRPRVILTAGHCVHKGSGGNNGFYQNFLFVPSYRDGNAPYGKWSWNWVITTPEWASGNGNVPNAADFAILEAKDQSINGSVRKIGDVTGWLGYQTQSLIPNHATILGYPGNLDSGEKIHQITAGSFQNNGNNTVIYGSDMRGGSSGGPWIQNFGVTAQGQTDGDNKGTNRVIGVTSYGPTAVGPLYQGSSILNNSFLDILNKACSHQGGNC